MTYRDVEKERMIAMRDTLFRDAGGGVFKGTAYPFILKNPRLNLWDGIREDAYQYFAENAITWWGGEKGEVTGHLLSSQVACLNHLYPLRQREDMATAILKALREDILKAERMDSGFVEFEVVGRENYLGERTHSRGINATSIDAVMVGRKKSGANLLVMIEWKYTEEYGTSDLHIPARAIIYDRLIHREYSPLRIEETGELYYEPFYQLMRQTLLGWLMVKNGEYGCDEYLHLHVIPKKNNKLRETITAPGMAGDSMSDAWKRVLVEPAAYMVITPEKLLEPLAECAEPSSLMRYLEKRYWEGDA